MKLVALLSQPALRLLDQVPTPMSASDASTRLVYVNAAFCREFAVTVEEAVGNITPELFPRAERSRLLEHWAAWRAGESRLLRTLLPTSGGPLRPYLIVPGPIFAPDGAYLGVVAVFLRAEGLQNLLDSISDGRRLHAALTEIAAEIGRTLVRAEPEPSAQAPGDLALATRTRLTERELEVGRLLARGDRVANIAAELGIRPVTVRNHLKAMFRKTGLHSQRELIELFRSGRSTDPGSL